MLDFCDFCVWTTLDMVIIRIEPDQKLIDALREKSKLFFVNVVLPELIACRFTCSSDHLSQPAPQPKKACKVSVKKKKKLPLLCYCKRNEEYDNMVCCENDECPIEWYHLTCVGLDHLPGREEVWICQQCV